MFVNDSSKNNKKALGWLASVVLHALVIMLFLNINYLSGTIAKQEFTPEKEQNIRQGIRKIVIVLKPFMNEFKPLLSKN